MNFTCTAFAAELPVPSSRATASNATPEAVLIAGSQDAGSDKSAALTLNETASTTSRPIATTREPTTDCERSFIQSDECLQNALFIGQQRADIPHTLDHIGAYCEDKKSKFNCIRAYGSKCLKNVPRQIYLTITKNVKKMFKEFCDSDAGKQCQSLLIRCNQCSCSYP